MLFRRASPIVVGIMSASLLLAGCGSSDGSSSGPPAVAVPPDAPQQIRQLAAGLESPEPLTRAHAASRLGRAEEGRPHAVTLLLDGLQDPSPLVRAAAADALGAAGEPKAIEPLIRLLKNRQEDRDVRSRAAESLGRLRAVPAVDPLSAALNDTVWHVRYHAAEALGRIGDPRARSPLERTAQYDPDHRVRVVAKQTLQALPAPASDSNQAPSQGSP